MFVFSFHTMIDQFTACHHSKMMNYWELVGNNTNRQAMAKLSSRTFINESIPLNSGSGTSFARGSGCCIIQFTYNYYKLCKQFSMALHQSWVHDLGRAISISPILLGADGQ